MDVAIIIIASAAVYYALYTMLKADYQQQAAVTIKQPSYDELQEARVDIELAELNAYTRGRTDQFNATRFE